jgi:hypothetical protein
MGRLVERQIKRGLDGRVLKPVETNASYQGWLMDQEGKELEMIIDKLIKSLGWLLLYCLIVYCSLTFYFAFDEQIFKFLFPLTK